MDLAKIRATEILHTAKDALESPGKLKKEIKDKVVESLQGPKTVALELVDSRNIHRLQTERARAEGARELAWVERAHTKQLAALM